MNKPRRNRNNSFKISRLYICLIVYFILGMRLYIYNIRTYDAENIDKQANAKLINTDKVDSYELRGCWISYIDIEKYLKDLNEQAYNTKINEIINVLLDNNLNTIFFQVRPMGDAIYYSDYYHLSNYISSDGYIPYDPLENLLEIAHQYNVKVHAWINPYRLSLSEITTNYYKDCSDYDKYMDFIIEYENSNGEKCLSLDPGRNETIDLITNGVKELVERYDIDGIHFDDYFYMPEMKIDLSEDEKKTNVNKLIRTVYSTIKACDSECLFGISPAGNLDYARSIGADLDSWLSNEGYIDYLIPQIYWTDNYIIAGTSTSMFTNRCISFQNINKLNFPMYVGLAAYKVGDVYEDDIDWSNRSDNLAYQYLKSKEYNYKGYALFRYDYLCSEIVQNELLNLNNTIINNNLDFICKNIVKKLIKIMKILL